MKTILFERLEKAGLIKRGHVHLDSAVRMPFAKALDLLDTVTADTNQLSDHIHVSAHTSCASFGLGGGRDECWQIGCRIKAVDELARFAALYSDQVFVHNYLADNAPSWGHPPDEDSTEFRQSLIDDLQILLHIRPLIEEGRIIVLTPPATTCPYCYAKRLFGTQADKRLRQAMMRLQRDLYGKMSATFSSDEFGYMASFSTEENLFRHSTHVESFESPPEPIAAKPRLMRRITDGETITLSDELKSKLGFHKGLAEMVLISLRYQMSVANLVGASFVTDRDVDVKTLTYLSDNSSIDRRNAIAAKYLKSIVPFAGDVPVNSLLRLRKREAAAFIQFRSSLDKAMGELTSNTGNMSEHEARILYSDIIAPELAKLDRKVSEAKRDLVKAPLASAAGAVAMIAFGVYSGMVPAELRQIAGALGLAKVVYDTASKAVDLSDTKKSIRPESYYFLWKVKQLSRRH